MNKKMNNGYKNIKNVMSVIGFIIMLAILEAYLAPLNNEKIIENWGIGLLFLIIFSVLYCIPIKKFLFRPKKLWFFLIIVSICLIIIDWDDFILFLRGG